MYGHIQVYGQIDGCIYGSGVQERGQTSNINLAFISTYIVFKAMRLERIIKEANGDIKKEVRGLSLDETFINNIYL